MQIAHVEATVDTYDMGGKIGIPGYFAVRVRIADRAGMEHGAQELVTHGALESQFDAIWRSLGYKIKAQLEKADHKTEAR